MTAESHPSPEHLGNRATMNIMLGADPVQTYGQFVSDLGPGRFFSREKRTVARDVREAAEASLLEATHEAIDRGGFEAPVAAVDGLKRFMGVRRHLRGPTRGRFLDARAAAEESVFDTAMDVLDNPSTDPDSPYYPMRAVNGLKKALGHRRLTSPEGREMVDEVKEAAQPSLFNASDALDASGQPPSGVNRRRIAGDYRKVAVSPLHKPSQVANRGRVHEMETTAQALRQWEARRAVNEESLREGRARIPTQPTREKQFSDAYEKRYGTPYAGPPSKKAPKKRT